MKSIMQTWNRYRWQNSLNHITAVSVHVLKSIHFASQVRDCGHWNKNSEWYSDESATRAYEYQYEC